MAPVDLDAWLDEPVVRTRHRRRAAVAPDALWEAAESLRVRDTRALGRLVRWRIPGTSPETTFRELFRAYPFVLLDEGENWSLSGLAGRIWTLDRDYPRLDGPDGFRTWDSGGTVRVLMAHWVEPDADGAILHSEARVQPVDRRARLRLRAVWLAVGRFERLIGGEALALAVRRAEDGSLGCARERPDA